MLTTAGAVWNAYTNDDLAIRAIVMEKFKDRKFVVIDGDGFHPSLKQIAKSQRLAAIHNATYGIFALVRRERALDGSDAARCLGPLADEALFRQFNAHGSAALLVHDQESPDCLASISSLGDTQVIRYQSYEQAEVFNPSGLPYQLASWLHRHENKK